MRIKDYSIRMLFLYHLISLLEDQERQVVYHFPFGSLVFNHLGSTWGQKWFTKGQKSFIRSTFLNQVVESQSFDLEICQCPFFIAHSIFPIRKTLSNAKTLQSILLLLLSNFRTWESPQILLAPLNDLFERVKQFQNLKFTTRRPTTIQNNVLSSSEVTAANYLAFIQN